MKRLICFGTAIIFGVLFGQQNLEQRTVEWNKKHPNELPRWMTPDEELIRDEIGRDFYETPPPVGPVRNIAEFEKMEGVLIRYPFGISYAVIAEMAEDIMVTTIVTNQSQENSVINMYQSNGVNLDNCNFIHSPSDTYWTRDYGPWYIADSNNDIAIVNFVYNRPRPNDNDIPLEVAEYLNLDVYGMDIETAGGNYMTEGMGIASSSDLIWDENNESPSQIDALFENYLGIEEYHVLDDPNNTYIDHIDCWGKFLDIDKVIIRSVSQSHAQYDEIEATANYFASQNSSYGYPYEVYRVYTPQDQPYTNSLILNNKVLVPTTGSSWDDDAIASYQEAMPGYEIVGVSGSWESTDALHCRTKGIADREMIYISHIPILPNSPSNNDYIILADVIPYSHQELNGNPELHVKINETDYEVVQMTSIGDYTYQAIIPQQFVESTISYFITAEDDAGNFSSHPFIGQPDPHVFYVEGPQFTEVTVNNLEGWNLVGMPLFLSDMNYTSSYINATPNTLYSYSEAGYQLQSEFQNGLGYWLHFGSMGENNITGEVVDYLNIQLFEGWNLISGMTLPVLENSIIDPDNIIVPNTIYGFYGSQGYQQSNVLEPGEGYWIRTFEAGTIELNNQALARRDDFDDRTKYANSITINGKQLFFGIQIPESDVLSYSLPPKPPLDAFDIRYSNNSSITNQIGYIEVMNQTQVLEITYNSQNIFGNWVLMDTESSEVYSLNGVGEHVITGNTESLILKNNEIANQFGLHQNFPNPFNPTTTLSFSISTDSYVDLSIIDITGRKVVQLTDSEMSAGYHEIIWDATQYSSGIYFVKMENELSTQVQKIMYIK
jgi:agmatine deiminase